MKSCERAGQPHRKKTELARESLDVLARWTGARRVEIAADSAYCNDTVTRGLPESFVLFGAMRPDAVLTAPPPTRHRKPGRPSRRGRPRSQAQAIAKDGRRPWLSCEATLYGVRRVVERFGDSSARKRAAVERTAPVGLVYTTLVLWFAEGAHRTRIGAPPLRRWYRHKRGLCFADVLRAAQRALTPLDVLDPRRSVANLRKPRPPSARRPESQLRRAA